MAARATSRKVFEKQPESRKLSAAFQNCGEKDEENRVRRFRR
jgi:hypothetical protein